MNKRVGAIEEFEFKEISEGDDLQVTIAITGWLTKENNGNYLYSGITCTAMQWHTFAKKICLEMMLIILRIIIFYFDK